MISRDIRTGKSIAYLVVTFAATVLALCVGWSLSIRNMVNPIDFTNFVAPLEIQGRVFDHDDSYKYEGYLCVSMRVGGGQRGFRAANVGEQGIVVRGDEVVSVIAVYGNDSKGRNGLAKIVRQVSSDEQIEDFDSIVWYLW